MYCMPHEGEVVNLYFRDGWEGDAIAISGARENGQTCQKTGDYNHRYFTTHERKELYLSPDTLSFTADENAASKITIKMTEQDGIAIASAKDIVLGATGSINIKGKTISVEAGSVSDMAASALGAIPGATPSATQPGLYLNTGLASIVLKDNKANFYGKPVKVEGRNKAPCPQPEQVPADEEEEGMSALDWLQVGLTVASFIPVIGTPAALLDAGISAARGDYAGAALSVATAVPFAGSVAAVGKVAKSSKIAARISKTLKAGKKITKVSKMIKPRCFALGKGVTRTVKFNPNTGKMIKETAEAIAKKGSSKAKNVGKWSADSGFYEVGYRVKLPKGHYPGVSDARHFQEANKQLHIAFQADPKFAQQMEKLYPGIVDGVKPGGKGAFPRRAPTKDVTWHHHATEQGALDLVPRNQHGASGKVQSVLHPEGRGGMENWGGGR